MKSDNLQLRALEPADVDLLYNWENDTSVWHLSNTLAPFSRFALEQYVLNAGDDIFASKQLRLMIDLHKADPPETIGCIDMFDFDPGNLRAGIGIMILDRYRGKGFASEALDMMIEYAFGILRLHQLYSNVTHGNRASLELFRKKDFQVVGLKEDWIRHEKQWTGEYLLQLINKDPS